MKKEEARGITTFMVSTASARAGAFHPAASDTAPARRSLPIARPAMFFPPRLLLRAFRRNYATGRAMSSRTIRARRCRVDFVGGHSPSCGTVNLQYVGKAREAGP